MLVALTFPFLKYSNPVFTATAGVAGAKPSLVSILALTTTADLHPLTLRLFTLAELADLPSKHMLMCVCGRLRAIPDWPLVSLRKI